ncbi:ABC transporter ATP-binding protein [Arthrobacter sp. SD76]|uniref:ABC transporter ATP-binding protein n=1 Tax=Arthrobacter sp. SD76 TaxID=3415007 RepID=UPI003C762996
MRGRSAKGKTREERNLRAVQNVSFELRPGSVLALVGESGSGKSTAAKLLALLEQPTEGEIVLDGAPVVAKTKRQLREYRKRVQIVFQDPYSSLNPMHSVRYHLTRPLLIHGVVSKQDADAEVRRLLERVQLTPADRYIDKMPHELSGGQRQRVAIAAALAVRPEVLLLDEPVSMLDVSIRLEILNLIANLSGQDGLALLYITHDIASARYFADRIIVMYRGQVVEQGSARAVVDNPQHEYTQLLISSAPDPDRTPSR